MLLYDHEKVRNLLYAIQLYRWKQAGAIDHDSYAGTLNLLQPRYKTSNIFLRTGLFLLTVIITFCSVGLLTMILGFVNNAKAAGVAMIIFSIVIYFICRYFIREKNFYANGVDDALAYISTGFMISAIVVLIFSTQQDPGTIWVYFISAVVLLFATMVFADKLLAAVAFLSVLGFIFYAGIEVSAYAKFFLPFLVMIIAAAAYFYSVRCGKKSTLFIYHDCYSMIEFLSLIVFYLSGNYYVIHQAGKLFFETNEVALGGFFWIFTCAVPVLYLVIAVRKKDRLLLIAGLILAPVAILTVRYYHSVLPLEAALMVGGGILLAVSSYLIQVLKRYPRGFTFEEDKSEEFLINPNLEALMISQVMASRHVPVKDDKGIEFGGGEFGGGGAGGSFEN